MFEQGISRGAENVNDPCFRKKTVSENRKGLKQRSKALSDVKNTIHSHASSLVEKNKNEDKNGKKGSVGFGKSTKKSETSKLIVLEEESDMKSGVEPEFECLNHSLCEKANNLTRAEFFDEYKLTEKELDCFSDRMKFFRMDPPPFKIRPLSPVEDVEVILSNNTPIFHDDLIDDIVIEVPEPSHF